MRYLRIFYNAQIFAYIAYSVWILSVITQFRPQKKRTRIHIRILIQLGEIVHLNIINIYIFSINIYIIYIIRNRLIQITIIPYPYKTFSVYKSLLFYTVVLNVEYHVFVVKSRVVISLCSQVVVRRL